jgi:hypothetical protein
MVLEKTSGGLAEPKLCEELLTSIHSVRLRPAPSPQLRPFGSASASARPDEFSPAGGGPRYLTIVRTAVRYTGEIFWLLNERRLQWAEQADLERLLAADAHIMRDIGLIDGTPRYRSGPPVR